MIHLVGCGTNESDPAKGASQDLDSIQEPKVLIGESLQDNGSSDGAEIEAKLMWPTDIELDMRSMGPVPLAGRFLTDPPEWGSYIGVSQSSVEDDKGVRFYNEIHLLITSLDAIDMLKQYAIDHKYIEAIIVVFTDTDLDSENGMVFFRYESARSVLDEQAGP